MVTPHMFIQSFLSDSGVREPFSSYLCYLFLASWSWIGFVIVCQCVSVTSDEQAGGDVSFFPQVSTFLWWQSIWNLSEDSGCKTGIPTSSGFLCQVRCGHHAGGHTHNQESVCQWLVFIVNHSSGSECYLGRTGHLVGRLAVSFIHSVCWGVLGPESQIACDASIRVKAERKTVWMCLQ